MSDNQEREIKDLSPEEKRALLAKLLRNKASQTQSKSEYALAYGQRALWFIHQLAPESSAYHIASTSRVRSLVDIDAFKRALQHLVNRHPALRTTYEQRDDQLVQVIHAHQEAAFKQIDASAWDEDELYEQVVRAHKQPIDLANGPVIRWQLFTKSPTDHVFLITVHHIASDGYSTFALLYDLKLAYDAEIAGQKPALPPLKATYTDYVDRQMSLLASEKGNQLKAYWLNQLSGELPILNLPLDFPRPPIQGYDGASVEFVLDTQQTARLKELAMREGVTLYVLLLSIFQTQLHRYSGQNDLLIGSPNSNRDLTEFGGTVGYFVDPVVLRSTIEAETTFKTLLGQTRKTVIDAVAHQGYPFVLLVEQLAATNDPSRSPLFQVMFNLQSLQRIETTSPLFQKDQANPNALMLEPFIMPYEEGQFDLMLDVVEVAGTLWFSLKYNIDLYEQSTIARMTGHYQTLIEGILANPETPISRLPLPTEAERRQILVEWNDTRVDYPQNVWIHQLFERQVEKTPDAPAVIFEGQTLTYAQLNQRANQLARYLGRVEKDTLVGVCMERSLEMVVSLYAVLKAGGAYVPMDPEYPADRLSHMLSDSAVGLLLTQANIADKLPEHSACVIRVDSEWPTIAQESAENLNVSLTGDDLAYMIYTSGSTGKPKGALNTHKGVYNRLMWMQDAYELTTADAVMQKTPFSFDVSVWEFFWPLMFGARLVVAQPGGHRDPDYLIELINEQKITTLHFVPSMLAQFVNQNNVESCVSLRRVICSGEALPLDLQTRFFAQLQSTELHNLYGPTEAAIDVTYWACDPNTTLRTVPIGRAIANTQIYLLDPQLQPVPIGIPGELHIGGVNLARGYHNRPELTAEKFIPNPFENGTRLYKTGDLVRWLPDGNIEYLGRIDHQVKIRGFRIELGEIEATLNEHTAVRESTVIVREDTEGDKRIVAYIVLNPDTSAISSQELRNYLQESLPEYMIPSAFVTLEMLPLSPNGKVDRKALPMPQREARPEIDVQNVPTKPMEILIADIWREVLEVNSISIYDNFFDLGGHSLQVMQVVTRMENKTGLKINPVTMRMQTLGQLALTYETQTAEPPAVPAASPTENKRPQNLLGSLRRFVTGKNDKG